MNVSDVAVFVTVDALFPGATADENMLRETLRALSRDDALFTCARINAVVSGFGPGRSVHARQTQAAQLLCSTEQLLALDRYARRHGGPERVMLFFRGQLLELARWIATHCENQPGDGATFADPATRSAFVRAALIASALWEERLLPGGIRPNLDPRAQLRQILGGIRKNVEQANRAPHAGFTVSRGWQLFTRYLPAQLPEFEALFLQATGLTLRQYFICTFALLQRTFSDEGESTRIIRTPYLPGDSPLAGMFKSYLQLQSQTPEEWARSVQAAPNDAGYLALRKRPVLRFAGERAIIFDPAFYLDNLTSAPLFQAISAGAAPLKVFSTFGKAFEDYAKDLLRRRFPEETGLLHRRLQCNVEGTTATGEAFEIDAIVNDVTVALFLEVKAAWLKEETILGADPEAFLKEMRSKYGFIEQSGERGKGVAQLARSIGALVRREWQGPERQFVRVHEVYPVLTVFDTRMGAPGLGQFLEDEFRTQLGAVPQGIFVHPLIILTIEDLEHIVYGIDTLSLQELLRAYSSADPERESSLHSFIAHSRFASQVRPSLQLSELSEEFLEAARAELFPASDTSAPQSRSTRPHT
jgi:hypothetical protein